MAEDKAHPQGRVVRVIGPVVDVEFPPSELPDIYTALKVDVTLENATTTITCEVAQHIGDNIIRAIALKPTDGLTRGAPVVNTGAPISRSRRRRGASATCTTCSASRSTPTCPISTRTPTGRSTASRRRSRTWSRRRSCSRPGIKVIDLLEPYVQGGKIGMFGGAGVGKTVIIQEMIRASGGAARRRVGVRRRRRAHTSRATTCFLEMTESGVLAKTALVFGQMDEPPGVRLRVALSALTMAEYFRDELPPGRAAVRATTSSASRRRGRRSPTLLGRMPSAVGCQPNLAGEMGALRADRLGRAAVRSRSLQAIYVPGGRHHGPGAARGVRAPGRHRVLSRDIASLGIYPAVDPLDSSSRILDPRYVGEEHYAVAPACAGDPAAIQGPAGHHRDPRDGRAVRGGQGDRVAGPQDPEGSSRSPSSSRSSSRACPGSTRRSTRRSRRSRVCEGEYDHLPEQAFFLVGGIEEAVAQAKQMEAA